MKITQDGVRSELQQQLKTRLSDHIIIEKILPEKNLNLRTQFSLFTTPVVVWTPKNAFKNRTVPCPLCPGCIPKVKEYCHRYGEDPDYTVCIVYMAYTCAGTSKTTNGERFTTISREFLNKIGTALANLFPYMLSYKKAIHEGLFHEVHQAMMSPKGLAPLISSLKARRMKRYTDMNIEHTHDPRFKKTPAEQRPKAASVQDFLHLHRLVEADTFQTVWLKATVAIEELARATMNMSVAKHAISFDGTYKFPGKLKTAEPNTNLKITLPQMKCLHIVQNEIGQIMDITFMDSESHDTIGPVLKSVRENQEEAGFAPTAEHPIIVVTDHLNNTQAVIEEMGEGYLAKQDPFHVIKRILDKVADKDIKKKLHRKLSRALYLPDDQDEDLDGEHRNAAEAAIAFQAACDDITSTEIGQRSLSEWNGTVGNNVGLIRDGYLQSPGSNVLIENGVTYKLLHTSGVESTNALLKSLVARRVSYKVGVRILHFFVVEKNLRCGARAGRWPDLKHMDILTLIKLATTCGENIPPTPQIAFAQLLMTKLKERPLASSIRTLDSKFFLGSTWSCFMFQLGAATAKDLSSRQTQTTTDFLDFLNIDPTDETRNALNAGEFHLLKQIRNFQATIPDHTSIRLSACPLVLTLLYNTAVRRLGPDAIARKIGYKNREFLGKWPLRVLGKPSCADSDSAAQPDDGGFFILHKLDMSPADELLTITAFEADVSKQMFHAVRKTDMTYRKKHFVALMTFVSMLTPEYRHRTPKAHATRWDRLRSQRNNENSQTKGKTTPQGKEKASDPSPSSPTLNPSDRSPSPLTVDPSDHCPSSPTLNPFDPSPSLLSVNPSGPLHLICLTSRSQTSYLSSHQVSTQLQGAPQPAVKESPSIMEHLNSRRLSERLSLPKLFEYAQIQYPDDFKNVTIGAFRKRFERFPRTTTSNAATSKATKAAELIIQPSPTMSVQSVEAHSTASVVPIPPIASGSMMFPSLPIASAFVVSPSINHSSHPLVSDLSAPTKRPCSPTEVEPRKAVKTHPSSSTSRGKKVQKPVPAGTACDHCHLKKMKCEGSVVQCRRYTPVSKPLESYWRK
ncbi:hypothetical protein DFS34DRAFT_682487 [Phlyctochytrium arcticum]|nr:hypothetical protein DFS34DRAFT_682487 [Phlyctochytrium arcticum]